MNKYILTFILLITPLCCVHAEQQSKYGRAQTANQDSYQQLNGTWRTASMTVRKTGQIVSTRASRCELSISGSQMIFRCSEPVYTSKFLITPQGSHAFLSTTKEHSKAPASVGTSAYIEFDIVENDLKFTTYANSTRESKDKADVVVTSTFTRVSQAISATDLALDAHATQNHGPNNSSQNTEGQTIEQVQPNRASNQQCKKDILAIHQQAAREVQAARTAEESNSAEYTQMRRQKDLFTGRCSQYPDAAAFIATADKVLEKGDRSSGAGNSQSSALAPSSQGTTSNSTDELQADSRVVFTGPVTSNCITYEAKKRTDYGTQWYRLTNKCSVMVNVWVASLPSGEFGSLAIIKGGGNSESWFSTSGPYAVNAIKYHACREKEGTFTVHLDKKSMQCYYRR